MRKNSKQHGPEPEQPSSTEGALVAAEAGTHVVKGNVQPNPKAVDYYTAQGAVDARNPGADVDSEPGTPTTPPSGAFVSVTSRTPVRALGEAFHTFHQSLGDGTFGGPAIVKRWRVALGLLPQLLVLLVALYGVAQVEIYFGEHGIELLLGLPTNQAAVVAVGLTIVVNVAAYFAAGQLYAAQPTIVRRFGAAVFAAVIAFAAFVALGLGLVIGGFDAISIDTGGNGGANTAASPELDTQPLLALTYVAVIMLGVLGVVAGHLLFLDLFDTRYDEAVMATCLVGRARDEAALARTRRFLGGALESALEQVRERIDAYNASFFRECPLDVAELFVPVEADDSAPEWQALAEELEALLVQRLDPRDPDTRLRLVA